MRVSIATVKRHHLQLVENGLLIKEREEKGQAYRYKVVERRDYKEKEKAISGTLDKALSAIEESRGRLSGPVVAQCENEPVNPLKKRKR